jgi:hypothetical protein
MTLEFYGGLIVGTILGLILGLVITVFMESKKHGS